MRCVRILSHRNFIEKTLRRLGQPYLIHAHDVTSKPKTADTLLNLVYADILYFINVLKIIMVAWCSDAGGDSASMRRKLKLILPWLIVLDCWAHQVCVFRSFDHILLYLLHTTIR